jgi:hypothetical protein
LNPRLAAPKALPDATQLAPRGPLTTLAQPRRAAPLPVARALACTCLHTPGPGAEEQFVDPAQSSRSITSGAWSLARRTSSLTQSASSPPPIVQTWRSWTDRTPSTPWIAVSTSSTSVPTGALSNNPRTGSFRSPHEDQRRAVQEGGQNLGPVVAVRPPGRRRPPHEPVGQERERERPDVGQHVSRVGEKRERGCDDPSDDFAQHVGGRHRQGEGQPAIGSPGSALVRVVL